MHEREGIWTWSGNDLIDQQGGIVASVISDVIYLGEERLLIESSPGPWHFRARATTGEGEVYTLIQNSLSVARLSADCVGRRYTLERTSPWRKERRILDASGAPCAVVTPRVSGKVEVSDAVDYAPLPLIDAVFLSWGCVLVDSPVRRPRV
ncbi:hypothetical protein L1O03_03270 [Corynebacterium uropygiale]|uniref:Uncharacterized protein n=2 Tax=Corynebacterium uropygiale TaxID=1775911 RepID=A0A9X1TXK5_9CORY|nr:hypothetical protein [Corynebacterium uropygiale]MCF4006200.1 hypothetical protein [Corynebacterium uropygiale]